MKNLNLAISNGHQFSIKTSLIVACLITAPLSAAIAETHDSNLISVQTHRGIKVKATLAQALPTYTSFAHASSVSSQCALSSRGKRCNSTTSIDNAYIAMPNAVIEPARCNTNARGTRCLASFS